MLGQFPALIRLVIVVGGIAGACVGVKHLRKKRVFISFAIEDKNISELMVGQASNKKTPFEFVDMSAKKAWDNAWKTQCRKRIKACDGVIVLVSKNTYRADGVHWEVKCAKEENIPIRAMYARNKDKGCRIAKELKGQHIYKWSWSNITNFVNQLK